MSKIASQLHSRLGGDVVSSDHDLLETRRHDYWVRSHLDDLQGRRVPQPAAVLRPKSTQDVVRIVRACSELGIAVIPFGLGSGVCGGVRAGPDSIVLDMSSMNAIREINEIDLLASFDAGRNGMQAENDVAAKGLTIGHWPQSIALSSVGGWVATRASGQLSTGNGNIEDLIYAVEAVLPDGTVVTAGKAPRAAAGPDLRHIFMGSEGVLGIITGVTFSLRRAPARHAVSAFHVMRMADGFEAQRHMIQSGWTPVVVRQYDEIEAKRSFSDQAKPEHGMIVMVHEGPAEKVEAEKAAVAEIFDREGFATAPDSAVTTWLERRNHVPHWDDFLKGRIILDTIEVSAPWSRINELYHEAVRRLREVPDMLNASAHSSHAYRSGLNLYFTFAARPDDPHDMAGLYDAAWSAVLEATEACGGGIAHHHGIGRVRRNFLASDLGTSGVALLRTIKGALDPAGLMNPGVLLPDE